MGAFWATLERHRKRETAPPSEKGTSVAMQQWPICAIDDASIQWAEKIMARIDARWPAK
jgi:hypothetical protein